jgi:hypothetical protein
MNQPNLDLHNPQYVASVASEYQPTDPVEPNTTFANDMLSASLGFIVLFSSFVLFLCSMRRLKTPTETPHLSDEMKAWSEKMAVEVPCRNCRYFKANRYLPCAVNPVQVLTTEAQNCGDYQEREMGV